MVINKSGVMIRIGVSDLRIMGRATQGVRLINLKKKDTIASVAKVPANDEEEELEEGLNPDTENPQASTDDSSGDSPESTED